MFLKLFPKAHNDVKVLQFAVSTSFDIIEKKNILNNFDLADNYFVVLNQFWPHKNHQVVISAFKKLLQEHENVNLVFTGNINVDRKGRSNENDYITELETIIKDFKLFAN